MYTAETEAQAAAAAITIEKQTNKDATDGKFEDFLAAGSRVADLVAAGASAASNVAAALSTFSDNRGDTGGNKFGRVGPSGSFGDNGGAAYTNGFASLLTCSPGTEWFSASSTTTTDCVGRTCDSSGVGEGDSAEERPIKQKGDGKPVAKRGHPQKQEACGPNQCAEGAKRALFEAVRGEAPFDSSQ